MFPFHKISARSFPVLIGGILISADPAMAQSKQSLPDLTFSDLWKMDSSRSVVSDAEKPGRMTAELHHLVGAERRDPIWSPKAEAEIQSRLTMFPVSFDYTNIKCAQSVCEVILINRENIEKDRENEKISEIFNNFNSINSKFVSVAQAGAITTDPYSNKGNGIAILSYFLRKD